MIKRWNVPSIQTQIQSAMFECSNPYNDGFIAWPIKQDLYQIKWAVEEALSRCPEFAPESEFLKEHEQEQLLKLLKT